MCIIAATNTIGLQISISYCVDSYKDLAGESIITVIIIRNTMSFAIGYGVTPWVVKYVLNLYTPLVPLHSHTSRVSLLTTAQHGLPQRLYPRRVRRLRTGHDLPALRQVGQTVPRQIDAAVPEIREPDHGGGSESLIGGWIRNYRDILVGLRCLYVQVEVT